MSPTDKIPPTIVATVAAFRANAPKEWRESENVMKFAMEFFETGVTAGVGLIYDIETLPKAERDAAMADLKKEFARIVIARVLQRLTSLFGGEDREAEGPEREAAHVFGVDRGKGDFTPPTVPTAPPSRRSTRIYSQRSPKPETKKEGVKMTKIKNRDEVTAWIEQQLQEPATLLVGIKAIVPGATYSDGSPCTRPINVGWRNHRTGEEIRIEYDVEGDNNANCEI